MLQLVLMFAVLVLALVVPVMLAARMVGAERTGFGTALIAVILQMVLSAVVRSISSNKYIVILVALIVASAIYSFTLGTTLLKGFLVSIIALEMGRAHVWTSVTNAHLVCRRLHEK